MSLLSKLFQFALLTSKKYSIDESHGISHSMDILHYASNIYSNEVKKDHSLEKFEKVIYISAILHDMCDKKYMDEQEGIQRIELFLKEKISKEEIDITKSIISTMSYSKVKVNGFPNLKEYQSAYHIVREADLLCAYDFDRCMIYNLNKYSDDIVSAVYAAERLFENRVFKHFEDKLFINEYTKIEAFYLQSKAVIRLNDWKKIIKVIN